MDKADPSPEKYLQGLLFRLFGLELRKIPEGAAKTADFEVLVAGVRELVIELKSFDPSDVPEHDLDTDPADLLNGAMRTDNGPTRVGAAMERAAKQLSGYDCPKVLALLNYDECLDEHDLQAAYTGSLTYVEDDGTVSLDVSASRIANGRLREVKTVIDAFIWIDRWTEQEPAFRYRGERGLAVLTQFFGYAPRPSAVQTTASKTE